MIGGKVQEPSVYAGWNFFMARDIAVTLFLEKLG